MLLSTRGQLISAAPAARNVLPALALLLASCGGDDGAAAVTAAEAREVSETYANILHAAYGDSVLGARELETAIDAFLAAPSEETLAAARAAWTASRPAYLETEVARFYGGPIDDEETGPEGLLNSWPLDEAYIDYVVGPGGEIVSGGLVNDESILATIDAESIAALNQVDSEENVATGYHAIEFLLWGQDLYADSAGRRPYTDYVESEEAPAVARRRAYLEAVTALLITHLEQVRDAWDPEATDSYRAQFLADAESDPSSPIQRILIGMGSLSGAELAGERMNVAYTRKEQEKEHSCFSDTTLQDQLHDAIGIRNMYVGRYERSDGTVVEGAGISELVASRDPELDARMRAELDASIAAIEAIPGPFDQSILGNDEAPGRVAIKAAVDALRAQTRTIAEIAALLDITINLEE